MPQVSLPLLTPDEEPRPHVDVVGVLFDYETVASVPLGAAVTWLLEALISLPEAVRPKAVLRLTLTSPDAAATLAVEVDRTETPAEAKQRASAERARALAKAEDAEARARAQHLNALDHLHAVRTTVSEARARAAEEKREQS